MYKTSNRISHEAESLYGEHKKIIDSIEKKTQYIESNKGMQALMAKSAIDNASINLDSYNYDMEADALSVERQIEVLEKSSDANIAEAEQYVVDNPRIHDVAVKEAEKAGVKIIVNKK